MSEKADLDRDEEKQVDEIENVTRQGWHRRAVGPARSAPAPALRTMLHGGDQAYADEVTHLHDLKNDWPDRLPSVASF
jgi:hypothetical protein